MAARATTRSTRSKPSAVVAPEEVDDVPEFTTSPVRPDPKAATFTLFIADGVPWKIAPGYNFGAAMAYLNAIRKGNVRNAQFELIEHLVGPAGLDTLMRTTDNNPVKWSAVVGRAVDQLLGKPEAQEEDPGN